MGGQGSKNPGGKRGGKSMGSDWPQGACPRDRGGGKRERAPGSGSRREKTSKGKTARNKTTKKYTYFLKLYDNEKFRK